MSSVFKSSKRLIVFFNDIVKVSMKYALIPSGKETFVDFLIDISCGWTNLNTDCVALIQINLLQSISHGYTEAVPNL
jgi:hypothetical protein